MVNDSLNIEEYGIFVNADDHVEEEEFNAPFHVQDDQGKYKWTWEDESKTYSNVSQRKRSQGYVVEYWEEQVCYS